MSRMSGEEGFEEANVVREALVKNGVKARVVDEGNVERSAFVAEDDESLCRAVVELKNAGIRIGDGGEEGDGVVQLNEVAEDLLEDGVSFEQDL